MKQRFLQKYRRSISIGLWLVLSMVVAILWHNNYTQIQNSLKGKVSDTGNLVTQQFRGALFDNVNRLKNLKRRLEITDGNYFRYWNKDAALIVEQDPSFHFVEWIDSTGVITLVEPLEENKKAIGLDITTLDYRNADWQKARKDSIFNITHWLELVQGDYSFLVDQPVFIQGQFYGTITAGINLKQPFDNIMRGLEEYHIEIRDDKGTTFYTFGDTLGALRQSDFKMSHKICIGDASQSDWSITMTPNHLFHEAHSSYGNVLSLVLALILCVLVAASFYFMQKSSEAEHSHKEAITKLRSLIDASPLAICLINTNGEVQDFWNSAAEEMFGWTKEEAIGKFLPFIQEHNLKEFERLMEQCLEDGKLKDQEVVRSRKDGSEGVFLINAGTITGHQILVMIEDITEVKKYENQLKRSVDEKVILLEEIHHRVKNNLAIISGLIELQKDRIDQEKINILLKETQNRIYSIASVHEQLYKAKNFSEISLSEYVERLIDQLQKTYRGAGQDVRISTHLNSLSVNINQAIPLGLLINELITNSYQHAFDTVENPEILLTLEESGGYIQFVYQDNGKGLDEDLFEQRDSLGLNLIHALLKQIEADYNLKKSPNNGFGISFQFAIAEKGSYSNF